VGRRDTYQRGRRIPLLGELDELVSNVEFRVNQDGIGPGVGICTGPVERLGYGPPGDQRLGPRDDKEVLGDLRILAGPNLARVFIDGYEITADSGVKTAALRKQVVLDAHSSDSGGVELPGGD